MSHKQKLIEDHASLASMKEVVESYEEIAAMRMRKVKKSVLQNRDFFKGLNNIYNRVIFTYKNYLKKLTKSHGKKLEMIINTNGKTLSILISANTGLYGAITKKTFNLFIENVVRSDTDLVIIGRLGKAMYDSYGYKKAYKYFDVSDTTIEEGSLAEVLNYILSYTNIIVYHGSFKSVLDQQAVRTYVTGEALESFSEESTQIDSIIEPTVEEVTQFFEHQILSSIFEQTLYESSLSKYASRMVSLDLANENINELIMRTNFKILKQKHRDLDSKQLGTLGGLKLWGGSY